ncbi:YhgE/Pip domain-containing protein [Bacillus mesophilus]|uniref:YhgE/Pip domain-containing protein n=2 Tax=Bacillus mesophilus TaxID=1808955 RepID=A0A6M0Q3Z6_9BACI|nr:YhgE/Pip domain-containing protein [Bacillus mesophilus]
MMRKKQLLVVALSCSLFLPSFLVNTNLVKAELIEGKFTSKDEVVYATLNANGALNDLYVVNTIDMASAGSIIDYGTYTSVKNLTDLKELQQEGQIVRIDAPEGKFYYQGNLEDDTQLPWDVTISYKLDGQEIDPVALAGKSGSVEIIIETKANENGNTVFFENYLLQVSLLLPNTYRNIDATDGIIANAGKDKQITFTVMPGEAETLTITADAQSFEFDGIQIAALPSTLPIDTSEMDHMTEDMATLSDAIGELNSGVADLEDGVSQLNGGAAALRKGSVQYHNGISQAGGASSEIVSASKRIGEALQTINASLLASSSELDLTSLTELPAGLTQLAAGLTDTVTGLTNLQENYTIAYQALDGSIQGIPDVQLTDEEIAAITTSNADSSVVEQLLATYQAAQTVKATYSSVKGAFDAVAPALTQTNEAVTLMSGTLTALATELTTSIEEMDLSALEELQQGIAGLAANYGEFHSGLVSYTKGISQLSSSYSSLHSGIVDLSGGTAGLEDGVDELHNGTDELYQETKDLPEQIKEEINQMIAEYDKSDFEPVSFVSPKNEKVHSVQFVLKTESIEIVEPEAEQAKPKEDKGFWELFLDLFR